MIQLHIVPEPFFPKFQLINTHWQVFWLVPVFGAFPFSKLNSGASIAENIIADLQLRVQLRNFSLHEITGFPIKVIS